MMMKARVVGRPVGLLSRNETIPLVMMMKAQVVGRPVGLLSRNETIPLYL